MQKAFQMGDGLASCQAWLSRSGSWLWTEGADSFKAARNWRPPMWRHSQNPAGTECASQSQEFMSLHPTMVCREGHRCVFFGASWGGVWEERRKGSALQGLRLGGAVRGCVEGACQFWEGKSVIYALLSTAVLGFGHVGYSTDLKQFPHFLSTHCVWDLRV